jgi:hypothetical protein
VHSSGVSTFGKSTFDFNQDFESLTDASECIDMNLPLTEEAFNEQFIALDEETDILERIHELQEIYF